LTMKPYNIPCHIIWFHSRYKMVMQSIKWN